MHQCWESLHPAVPLGTICSTGMRLEVNQRDCISGLFNSRIALKSCAEPQKTETVASPGEGGLPVLSTGVQPSPGNPRAPSLPPWSPSGGGEGCGTVQVRNCAVICRAGAFQTLTGQRKHRAWGVGGQRERGLGSSLAATELWT